MFSETDIYECDVPGVGPVKLDPLALRRRLLVATSGRAYEWARKAKEYERLLTEAAGEAGDAGDAKRAEFSAKQAEVEGLLAEAAYVTFGMSPLDPDSGLGQTELVAVNRLYHFLAWLDEKKGSTGT